MSARRSNQKTDSPVSTFPLSGIGVGWTASYVEIRSLATISRRSPRSYISRTFPLATRGRSARRVVTPEKLATGTEIYRFGFADPSCQGAVPTACAASRSP